MEVDKKKNQQMTALTVLWKQSCREREAEHRKKWERERAKQRLNVERNKQWIL